MATTTVEKAAPPSQPPDRLSVESIAMVDLRLLTQSELTALSLCSAHAFDLRRCDDVVIPKIDRSVFNESAGSRKQTYSRLRLAPRKPDLSSPGPTPKARTPDPLDSDRVENSRIISLFKHLFNSGGDVSGGYVSDTALVPVDVQYSDSIFLGSEINERKRKRGRKPRSDAVELATTSSMALALVEKVEVVEERVVVDDCEEERRREEEEQIREEEERRREEEERRREEEERRREEEREKEVVNKNGVEVDLAALAKMEDPYGAEIKRRTEGREQPEELLGFMSDLNGQWGSRRKKRKIVNANEFGDALPNGWKVLIAMKKKQGQAWLFCRRYISPSGRYFVSCKEVSSYLISLTRPQDLEQQNNVLCIEDSATNDKWTSGNVVDFGAKPDNPPLYVDLQFNNNNQKNQLCTSGIENHERQMVLSTDIQAGEVQSVSGLKCHKCSTPFNEKDALLNHLLSCHKRKRRKSGAPIEDDVTMKDGQYECQFCNRLFLERNSYFGHVGIHVKNYAKSIGGSPGVVAKQKMSDPVSLGGVPVSVSQTLGSAEVNAAALAGPPEVPARNEPTLGSVDSKLKVGSDVQTHPDICNTGQMNLHIHAEQDVGVAEKDKASNECFDKLNEIVRTTDNEFNEVDQPVNVSTAKLDICSDSEKVLCNKNNYDLFGNSGEINATERAGSVMSTSPAVLGENGDTLPDNNEGVLENVSNFRRVSDMDYEGVDSENGLSSDSKEKFSNQDTEDRSLGNKAAEHLCYDEGMKLGDDDDDDDDGGSGDELIIGSDGDHIDMDASNHFKNTGNIKEGAAVSHEKEEACEITANEIEFMESTMADSKVERGSETSLCRPSGDQHTAEAHNYVEEMFTDLIDETEADMCSSEKAEVTADADHCVAPERRSEGGVGLVSKDSGPSYSENDSEKVPVVAMLEPQGTGGFQVEEACSLEDRKGEVSSRVGVEPKCDQTTDSSRLFFTSRSTDMPSATNVMPVHEQGKSTESSHIPPRSGKAHSDISNVLEAYSSFIENKQGQDSKSFLSGISVDESMQGVSMNNVTNVSAATTTTQLPQLGKVENSRASKLMLDFGGMSEMNARFLDAVQHQAVPEASSPFSLWGEQTCVEDNQSRGYGGARGVVQQERNPGNSSLNFGARGVAQQERASDNNSLNYASRGMAQHERPSDNNPPNFGSRGVTQQERASDNSSLSFVGSQQPCEAGYLNKVCTNEQRYGVQQNETGVYNRSSEAKGISHGNSLNLAGLQRQCDAGYNLNKPCLNQQNFGIQRNESGAYSTSDEARRERVAYGNSLSLASFQPTCDTGYSLNKTCVQQTCEPGYNLNKGYTGHMQGLPKVDGLQQSQSRDLMIGFGNSSSRPNQGVGTDFLWRATEGNILPGGLVNSSSQGQSPGSFQAFDFLSDKGGNGLYTDNQKFDNMSSFEGLRSTSVEPMEFSFLTTQDSNAQLEDPKVLSYNTQMDQGFGAPVWHQKGTSLPNMMGGHVVTTVCVWCGNEFHQDSLGCEMQAGSIGYLCPTCKARMSGQFL